MAPRHMLTMVFWNFPKLKTHENYFKKAVNQELGAVTLVYRFLRGTSNFILVELKDRIFLKAVHADVELS
jgi:hypothetical protein